ncbi:MAG: Stk1 family PASTA domain-containing Ser/Thr kinase [Aerococcus sp.]|nr:Stk1 family PASTA domain-containing Ser/Thr kinase [Aerococcus sp.]
MRPGQIIDGRYEIIRHIGSGGMATVYLALDPILNREVAIKFLRLNSNSDENALRRFEREAYSIAELNHPNIVNIYDIGDNEDGNYIVMEYVDGIDLKRYIKENNPLAPDEVQSILAQILDGMQTAHDHYVIHRDLKPQNIMIKPDGTVKIMDFGIAVISTETSITQTNTIIGSVHYLSPEQARGGSATPQSDIYALGIVGYEMLTGHVPFDGESAVSIAIQHFQEPLPDINDVRSDVPMAMQNVIYRATAKEASDRYESCQAMRQDLLTSLDPEREDEPKFVPAVANEETMVMATKDIKEQLTDQTTVVSPTPLPECHTRIEEEPKQEKKKEKTQTPPKEDTTKKRRLPRFLVILGGLVVLLSVAFLVIYGKEGSKTALPDLRGLTLTEAQSRLEEEGFVLGNQNHAYSDDVAKDRVISSNPKEGTEAAKNTHVSVTISDGKEPKQVPNVVNKNYDEAKKQLEQMGFTVQRSEDQFSDEVQVGNVMKQSVDQNQKVIPSETTIMLTVSQGPQTTTMPNMLGWSQAAVQDYANRNGLSVTFSEDYSDQYTSGQVMAQSISANTTIKRGDALAITLSKGSKPESSSSSSSNQEVQFTYDVMIPAKGDSDNKIEVYIEDKNHQFDDVSDSFTINSDRRYHLTFTTDSGKPARFKIVRDGEKIMDNRVVPDDE